MKIFIRGLLLSIVTISFFVVPAQAFPARQISSEYVENGSQLLKRGEIVLAVEQFMKALILDPQNIPAQTLLRQVLEREASVLSPSQRLQGKYFLDTVDYMKFLSARVDDLTGRNKKIQDFLIHHCPKDGRGMKWVDIIPDVQPTAEIAGDFVFVPRPEGRPGDFRFYNEALGNRKKILWKMLEKTLLTNKELRRVKSRMLSRTIWSGPASLKTEHVREGKGMPVLVEPTLPSGVIPKWQMEMGEMRTQIAAMKEKMDANDNRLALLTREIAGLSLEIYEKEKIIADKDTRLQKIQAMLADAHSRLMLVQQIIQEKDAEIAKLEAVIKHIPANTAIPMDHPETDDSSDLRALIRDELHAQIAVYKKQIQSLETQFVQMREQYQTLEQDLAARDEKIGQLSDMVAKQTAMLKRQELVASSKDEKLLEMDGVIRIYKGRLDDVYAELKQKQERLKMLEHQLAEDARESF